ncbi:MAG: 50S ribosomal protein L11 methyltransferase [Syntrophobacteraceae bacterium]
MCADENNNRIGRILHVYELKGKGRPPDPPSRELAGIWPQPPYYYLFYGTDALDAVLDWLESNPEWRLTSRYSLPYERWQDSFAEPLRVGPFSIEAATGAERQAGASSGIPVRIDPGIVFGSGLHPTTKGCLLAIADLFASRRIATVVDFGTGTGILAIACALLGARRTWAVDCVPLALAVARQNALDNATAGRIGFIAADRLSVLTTPSDLLVMNLELPILEAVLGGDDGKGYGHLVLSGFLEGALDRVEEMVRPWRRRVGTRVIEGWPTLTFDAH